MENIRNKSSNLNKKKYFDRFTKLNVYSYTKPNDKKINLGCKPTEVYSLFNGNTSSIKKILGKEQDYLHPDEVTIDQSALQYYVILALQDFYQNYYIPLSDENKGLKEHLSMLQTMMLNNKKKNDERFTVLTENLELLAQHINDKKNK